MLEVGNSPNIGKGSDAGQPKQMTNVCHRFYTLYGDKKYKYEGIAISFSFLF